MGRVARYLYAVSGHAPLRKLAHAAPHDQTDANDDHGKREKLTHRSPGTEEIANLHVRKPDEFDEDAKDSVEHEEGAEEKPARTRGVRLARQGKEHEEDDEALEERLVELRGMVHDARSREIDTNGKSVGRRRARHYEVRTATEEKSKGYTTGDEIGQGEEGDVIDLRVDETAMTMPTRPP